MRKAVKTAKAPPPAGAYSQAIIGNGLVFISGQTPRLPDGTRCSEASFEEQATLALNNLESVANAAGVSLRTHGVKVTVYLTDLENRFDFDRIYSQFVSDPLPARAIVQSNFTSFDIEIDAILIAQ
jgi:reactive intermediate/imine deaminase